MLLLKQNITRFLSTNLHQPYPAWDKNNTYPLNTTVLYKNYFYRTIVDNNQGVAPDLNTGKWLLMGVDNAYAAIDLQSHTSSTIDSDEDKNLPYIEYVFESISFDYLAFGGIRGTMLEIWEYDAKDKEVGHTQHAIGAERICANTWYKYFYCDIPDKNDLGKGKPIDYLHGNIHGNTVKIKVHIVKNSDGKASVGSMVGGASNDIGDTQFGVTLGLVDYSRKVTDEFGITTLTKRDAVETMTSEIVIPAQDTQKVKRAIKEALGTVVMFIANPERDSNYEHLIQLGYIEDFRIYIRNAVESRATLQTSEAI